MKRFRIQTRYAVVDERGTTYALEKTKEKAKRRMEQLREGMHD